MNKKFRIDWAVTTLASSAHEAACRAREIQEDPANTATVFSVEDKQTGEITVHDLALDGGKGENEAARRPADTTSRRSLRPGRTYKTRGGLPAEILEWDREGEFPLAVRFEVQGEPFIGLRTKAGLHPQNLAGDKPHPLDIVEVNPTIEKWVRVYDRAPLNESGKQVVSGKEFAPERGLHWYLFNTEQEARAQLRGVRAVFRVEYQEGQGIV